MVIYIIYLRTYTSHLPDIMLRSAHYIRKTPNVVFLIGALRAALILSPSTDRVSAGSITPSSHNLEINKHIKVAVQYI